MKKNRLLAAELIEAHNIHAQALVPLMMQEYLVEMGVEKAPIAIVHVTIWPDGDYHVRSIVSNNYDEAALIGKAAEALDASRI